MADEWRETSLGELVDFVSGGTPSKDNAAYWNGEIPWVSAKDMKRLFLDDSEDHVTESGLSNGTRLAPAKAVLLLTRGMTLLNDIPICVARRPMAFNQDVKALRPKGRITDGYIPYLLLGNKSRLLSLVDLAGHGTGRLNTDELKSLDVQLPPEDEQRAIAHILGTLDDKIELNRRMNETLEAMARTLFKSWFVDFDPVRAKSEGRNPALPKPFAELFPDSFDDSELGEIPQGWKIAAIGDHFDAVKGVSYKGSGLSDAGMPLHNLNSVYEGGGYKYEGIKYYNGEYAERHLVKPGDVIVANTEQGHDRLLIGYAAIVPRLFGERGIASHHIYCLRPKHSGSLTAAFLCQLLNSPQMHDLVSGYANGTTVNMLPPAGVQQPKIVVPPRPLVAAFDKLATQIESRREEMVVESRALASLRDTLLPKLISGKFRVTSAARGDGQERDTDVTELR